MRTSTLWLAAAAVVGAAVLHGSAGATNVVLRPSSQDAFIQKDKPNRIAGAGPTHTRVRIEASLSGNKTRRGLVQFDLSSVPAGSTINAASLGLFEGNSPSSPVTHGVHRIDEAWLQSAVKWNNQPLHAAVPTDTALVPDDALREFRTFDVAVDVQGFTDLCAANHGWMVRDQSEAGSSVDVNYVAREENAIPEQPHRPTLTLDFDPPPCLTDDECDDANPCTTNERCVANLCEVDPVDCDDGDPCTDDICDCTQGCINAPICNDGFTCTIDTCDPGTLECTNTPVDSFCLGACIVAATCEADPDSTTVDPVTGCDVTAVDPLGTPCDDGVFCTDGDTCDGAGACVPGGARDCDDGVACTEDACDEGSTMCVNEPNDGLCPDDGLFCTGAEVCDLQLDCTSTGDPCTGGLTCNETADGCADCGNGTLEPGEDCDGGACCDPLTCTFEPAGAACEDGAFCTAADTCDGAGGCTSGGPTDCGDGVGCTDDVCDEGGDACVSTPNDGNCPDDGLFCDGSEFCDAVLDCASTGDPCPGGFTCNEDADGCADCGNGTVEPGEDCDGGACCDALTCAFVTAGSVCSDDDPCTVGDACDAVGQCLAGTPVVCDHYVTYKAKAPAFDDPELVKFPSDWNVSLDDVLLANAPPAAFPDDPENYVVKKERSLVNPAGKNDEPGPFKPALHYVRYQIKRAREGIGPDDPPASGSFPKAVKAPKRLWHVENQFGDIVVRTNKVRALWVPAGKAEAPALPGDPGDATHYLCYQAKASKIPSDQEPDATGNGRGKFRKDLEHYFLDQFDDCAVFKDGVTVPFAGTPVERACLYVLKKPMELCSPVDKSAVVPPRLTAATIDASTASVRGEGLLCYQAKLVGRVRSPGAAVLGDVSVGDGLKQRPHAKRRLKDGTHLNVVPGNQFPPMAMDTKKAEFVCVPTTVLSVSDF